LGGRNRFETGREVKVKTSSRLANSICDLSMFLPDGKVLRLMVEF
jgi:hypothetical protein